ncbi:MAG: MBL fold metallo-hydrolase [Proteobacteria bacterium]|nr:MBL fold metallo-hydrolase [Pseudomonadota bacterium]
MAPISRLLLIGLGCLGLTAAATAATVDPYQRQTLKITDHAWLLYNNVRSTQPPFEGNVVVFEQRAGLVVVDAGGSIPSGKNLVAAIRGLSDKPVRFLIYTHYHGDHNLGAGAFVQAWPGVTIISSAATYANMTGAPMAYINTYAHDYQGMVDYGASALKDPNLAPDKRREWQHVVDIGAPMVAGYVGLKAWPANLVFHESIELPDDMAPLHVNFLGKANTDGDIVIWAPMQRVLATGDIVVNPIPYASASYPSSWLQVLDKLKEYEFAWLVPGHGTIQTDRRYLERVQAAIADIRNQVAPLAARGMSLDEVRKAVQLTKLQDEFAGNDAWDRAQMRGFFLDALVSNAYKEAKGEPIVQGHDGG